MKKRILSLMLSVLMVLALVPTMTYAAENALKLSANAVDQGETFTLTYSVPNALVDAGAISLTISFNGDLLEATTITLGSISGASLSGRNVTEANRDGKLSVTVNGNNGDPFSSNSNATVF